MKAYRGLDSPEKTGLLSSMSMKAYVSILRCSVLLGAPECTEGIDNTYWVLRVLAG